MLRLNMMLSNRFFKKMGVDSFGREWWARSDANVYRYYTNEKSRDPLFPKERWITIERFHHNKVVKKDTYKIDDPLALKAVESLAYPTSHIIKATNTNIQSIPLEEITKQAMSAFDKWYTMVASDPAHDIASDILTLGFGEFEFKIPLYAVDLMEATSQFIYDLHTICKDNQW